MTARLGRRGLMAGAWIVGHWRWPVGRRGVVGRCRPRGGGTSVGPNQRQRVDGEVPARWMTLSWHGAPERFLDTVAA
jgi:hypothetical protein